MVCGGSSPYRGEATSSVLQVSEQLALQFALLGTFTDSLVNFPRRSKHFSAVLLNSEAWLTQRREIPSNWCL